MTKLQTGHRCVYSETSETRTPVGLAKKFRNLEVSGIQNYLNK
jgi:hypothetical protein